MATEMGKVEPCNRPNTRHSNGAKLQAAQEAPAWVAPVSVEALYRLDRKGQSQSEPSPFAAVDPGDGKGILEALRKSLGEDPDELCRRTLDGQVVPVGLKNLGATCYLNSLLQYLFFNQDFRDHLLNASSESKVVAALQRVFALLAEGEQHTVDPSDFVTSARLDAVEQQDATEFSALLLDWLQRELGSGGDFIPALFEGEFSQLITSMDDPAHSSERKEKFTELRARLSPEVQAPKNKKRSTGGRPKAPVVQLEELLQETAFPDEVLDGSNQWLCPQNDKKVDARKTTRLSKLPPYLHVVIERYHYDRRTSERKRLGHTVSFPCSLELSLGGAPLSGSAPSVPYECVGFLEHVSDSAHSGHYRATLRQDRWPWWPADPVDPSDPSDAPECPAAKRRRSEAPRQWWTMDDDTVTAVSVHAEKAESSSSAPDRIESATAYLLLYRRADHRPDLTGIPSQLRDFVAEANAALAARRSHFQSRLQALTAFADSRQPVISRLAEALKRADAEESCCFVPSAWLDRFLRGEDRALDDILEGRMPVAPVLYGHSLLRRGCRQVMDPLALWCGEVKLVPSAALSSLSGQGGIDESLFLPAAKAMDEEVCSIVLELFGAWCQEQQAVAALMRAKIGLQEARAESQAKGGDFVWVARRLESSWKKLANVSGSRSQWHAFVEEVAALRRAQPAASSVPPEELPEPKEVQLQGGLLCGHNLVCRQKNAFVIRRAEALQLLEASAQKAAAWQKLWPAIDMPRLCTGLPSARLCGISDVCIECDTLAGDKPQDKVNARSILVKRRYESGLVRKVGSVSVPIPDGQLAAAVLCSAIRDQLKLQVLKLWASSIAEEVEVPAGATLADDVDAVVVEKDESAQTERENAFEGSIFRASGPVKADTMEVEMEPGGES